MFGDVLAIYTLVPHVVHYLFNESIPEIFAKTCCFDQNIDVSQFQDSLPDSKLSDILATVCPYFDLKQNDVGSQFQDQSPDSKLQDNIITGLEYTEVQPNLCQYCGSSFHQRNKCLAKKVYCGNCFKRGHFSHVCKSKSVKSSISYPLVTAIEHKDSSLSKAIIRIFVNNIVCSALIDTGSSDTFIDSSLADRLQLCVMPDKKSVNMASSTSVFTKGIVKVNLKIDKQLFSGVTVSILPDLCCDMVIGHDLLSRYKKLIVNFSGECKDLQLPLDDKNPMCSVAQAKITPQSLFSNLSEKCHPIACKSRKYSGPEHEYIAKEIKRLQKEGSIEPSESSWRAQVLVVDLESPKPRLVIDYSRTINKFTHLDAYPLPKMDEIALKVSQYAVYSAFDLRSAYHQIPILESERHYTAFEADGKLWQFKCIPFGVTNGVAKFQRTMDGVISKHNLRSVFAYLDNVIVCGMNQEDHDQMLAKFYNVIHLYKLTLNEDQSIISVREISMIGYLISHGSIKPDPERMKPLINLPIPENPAALKRALGLFSYYSQWIPKFSEKIKSLTGNPNFPLSDEAKHAFSEIKQDIAKSSLSSPNDSQVLVLESDASDSTLSASLTQGGRPIAFFSRTLHQHEKKHPPVEKEAGAIVESVRRWRHYLIGKRFLLITDQEAVSFIFNIQNHGKTKNSKIMRWRIELSCYEYDIKYRPGKLNVTADCLTRAHCSAMENNRSKLVELHEKLCHPGISRLGHYIRVKNLPYSMEDVKTVIGQCRVCAELKPQFYKPSNPPLIKATQPFERLSLDFKGPLPSVTKNKYLLTVVDEFSRYPFAFPCEKMTATVVMIHLNHIFSLFGLTSFTHSDRGPSLICDELRNYLLKMGIGYSNSTRYNPRGNGQVERFNGTIWKAVQLTCKSKGVPDTYWEEVLPNVLHSIRSLLCTATNQTPHERIFTYQRRSISGHTLPSWLAENGPVLLRKHARKSKYDPLCEEVDLIEVNPAYAKVKMQSGQEATVSLRDLAPLPSGSEEMNMDNHQTNAPPKEQLEINRPVVQSYDDITHHPSLPVLDKESFRDNVFSTKPNVTPITESDKTVATRQSSRQSVKPNVLNYDHFGGSNAMLKL